MKKVKRNLSIVLIMALTFSLMPQLAYASKRVKLNKSKLTLYVGNKYTLKLKNTKKKVKWSSSKRKIATVTKKGKVIAKKKGSCNVIAKMGKKRYVCKVTVKNKATVTSKKNNSSGASDVSIQSKPKITAVPTKKTEPTVIPTKKPEQLLVYDYFQEAPAVCNYDEFKYNSYCMWLCPFVFYGEGMYECIKDYRGKKLHYELTIKNSGERDLPVLDVCLCYTSPVVYPTVFRVVDPAFAEAYGYSKAPKPEDYIDDEYSYEDALERYNQKKAASYLEQPIEKGQTYIYSFDYTIPDCARNDDSDVRYPIFMYISNIKDASPYEKGDEITILGLKIYE